MAVKENLTNRETGRQSIRKSRKRHSAFGDFIKIAIFSIFLIYVVNVIISNQANIAEQKAEIVKLKEEVAQAQQVNDEYNRLLNSKSEYEYMREAAFEHGYAFPWEIRFFPISNPE